MKTDLLSIIVLSYNNKEMLLYAIDSVLDQTYPAIEIIICDDASSVFECAKVKSYIDQRKKNNILNVKIIINESNLGTVKNLNKAIMASNGEYIKAIAGDDAIASPDVCSKQIEFLVNNQDSNVVTGNIIECNEKMDPESFSGFLLNDGSSPIFYDKKSLIRYISFNSSKVLATQAICFRKEFFRKYGLYDESFVLIEDLPMAIRIITEEPHIAYINMFCAKHRGRVGVSTGSDAFDIRKINYYKDLEKYFILYLSHYEKILGSSFVRMRRNLCRFRIDYTSNTSYFKRFIRILLHLPDLSYYFFTQNKRFYFYMKNWK